MKCCLQRTWETLGCLRSLIDQTGTPHQPLANQLTRPVEPT
jgi:hypothetical protein